VLRSYHRKTLIKKEGWPEVDGWYWCPASVIKKRIKDEKEFFNLGTDSTRRWSFMRWEEDQWRLEARLAHKCSDGRIRAPSGYGIEKYTRPGGTIKLYGKCRFCDENLTDGIKGIILMETEM
jgi:hypothetical protein